MKYHLLKVLLLIALIGVSGAVSAERVAVIVNEGNQQQINMAVLRAIYSDLQFEWSNGAKIKLYELPTSTSAREKFAKSVLNKTAVEAATDWNNRKITNVINNRPHVKRDKLVLKRVARDENAIGYIPESLLDGADGVKVVLWID